MHISEPINRNIYCPIRGKCSIALEILEYKEEMEIILLMIRIIDCSITNNELG